MNLRCPPNILGKILGVAGGYQEKILQRTNLVMLWS